MYCLGIQLKVAEVSQALNGSPGFCVKYGDPEIASAPLIGWRFELFQRKKNLAVIISGSCFGSMYTGPTSPLYWPADRFAPARLCV
jgi:hypothetical protein